MEVTSASRTRPQRRRYPAREYVRRVLDILRSFLAALRRSRCAFRHVGRVDFAIGAVLVAWLAIDRLVSFTLWRIARRCCLSSLLGSWNAAVRVGLLGELIIFTHARISRTIRSMRSCAIPAGDAEIPRRRGRKTVPPAHVA